MDITHDPVTGCDGEWVAETIRTSRDSRVKYLIWNERICSSSSVGGAPPWDWRPYTGANKHKHHVHLSVKAEQGAYDAQDPWGL
jgi:hypothetical protein